MVKFLSPYYYGPVPPDMIRIEEIGIWHTVFLRNIPLSVPFQYFYNATTYDIFLRDINFR